MSDCAVVLKTLEDLVTTPTLLADACDALAESLLFGDQKPENDPWIQSAQSILSALLLEGVLRNARSKEEKRCG